VIPEAALALVLATGPSLPDPIDPGPKVRTNPTSLYQGRHYTGNASNRIRVCIRARESNHDYRAVSRGGTYRGAYQFSRALGVGAGWMIQKELRTTGVPVRQAIRIGRALRANPVNKWSPFYQDLAFWLVWNDGAGKHHWRHTVPGTGCF
jgi:hypothetical protein